MGQLNFFHRLTASFKKHRDDHNSHTEVQTI